MENKKTSYTKLSFYIIGLGFIGTFCSAMLVSVLTGNGPLAMMAMLPGLLVTCQIVHRTRWLANDAGIFDTK